MTQVLPKDVPQTLRRWKRYPAYKDSCVEWLGEIPEHWQAYKLKRVSEISYGLTLELDRTETEGTFIISLPNVTKGGQLVLEEVPKTQLTDEEKKSLLLRKGDLLFNWRNGSSDHVGKTAYFDAEGEYTHVSFLLRLRFDLAKHDSRYYHMFINNLRNTDFFASAKTRVNNTYNQAELRQLEVIVPPRDEQQAIASFLDRETAKIDALIAKKERLIELLQEKRTAIISHVVTKGLDSTVPLKDSGIEWLGEIPEDWRIVTVRNLIRSECLEIQDGNHGEIHPRAEDYVEMGIPFLMANNIRNGKIDLEECKFISGQQAKSLRIGFSKSGDVLLTHKGTLGQSAIIPQDIKFPFIMLTPQVTYYRIKKPDISEEFLYYYFQSNPFQERLKFIAGNQSTRDYVGLIAQKNFEIVLPSLDEQKAIASHLDRETAKIDALIAKIREGIEKLKEYRTALISAAVTGKIDVRNEVPS
jgi:type I restriction enzyme S subunit